MLRANCFYCGALLQPGEPQLRMLWDLDTTNLVHVPCTNVVHVPCAGAAIYHLIHRTGEPSVVLTEVLA